MSGAQERDELAAPGERAQALGVLVREGPIPGPRRDRRWLVAIALVAAGLMALGLGWGLPNLESWSSDDISPWVPLRAPKAWWAGWHKYPHLHPLLSLLLYAPLLLFWAATGRLDLACVRGIDPGCFSEPYVQLSQLMRVSRALSVLMGVGTVLAVHRLALRVHRDRDAALGAAAVAAVTSLLVFYAHLGNLDVPVVFWLTLSLVFLQDAAERGARRDFVALGLATGCALGTKEGVIGAYVLPGLALLAVHARRCAPGAGPAAALVAVLRDRRVWAGLAALLIVYGLATNPLLNPEGFVRHWQAWLPGQPRMEGYHADFRGWPFFFRSLAVQVRDALGAPLALLGAAGLLLSLPSPWRGLPALAALSYVAFSLAPAGYVPPRLVLPVAVIAAVYGGAAIGWALQRRGAVRALAVALAALALGHGFLFSLQADGLLLRDARYAAEAWIRAHTQPGERLASFARPQDLPRVAWLGRTLERIEPSPDRDPLGGRRPEWLLFSQLYWPRFEGERRAALERLVAGEGDYRVALDAKGGTPLDRWLGPRELPKVNPRIVILQRRDAD